MKGHGNALIVTLGISQYHTRIVEVCIWPILLRWYWAKSFEWSPIIAYDP